MTDKKHDFAKSALYKTAFGKDISLNTAPIDFKADKPKPKSGDEKEEEPEKYENPYEAFIKTWQQGDQLPLVPPGMQFHLCKYKLNNLDTDSEYLGLAQEYRKKPNAKINKKSDISDIDIKNLGPKLRNAVETVRQRALRRRGGLVPWVDENNKLRCPAGTPAANQFTDEMMSNCFIVSAETAAGAGRRAIRRAGAGADILASKPGQRVGVRTIPGDIDVSTPEAIRKLGPSSVQALMNTGGRVGVAAGVAGQMGGGFGFRADPKKRASKRAWQLGVKEQLERGRRATYLADELHERFMNPSRADGIRLPNGQSVGDIRNKANFMKAMTTLFPNVDPSQIEAMFDDAMPANLSFVDRQKFRKFLVSYYEGMIAEAIERPEDAKWMTRILLDPSLDAAVEMSIDNFAPSITSGGRLASITSQTAAQKAGNLAQGGAHITMKYNPLQMFLASKGYGHMRNGRANGISDSERGDALYIATHEFGHLSHFANVMRSLGFDTNAPRYGMTRTLTPGSRTQSGVPARLPNEEVGAWQLDWSTASNPMNSPSIAGLIQAAQRLQTRNYKGGNYGRGIYGFTRADLEQDLRDFYDGFIEAVHNNITDTPDDVEMMRAFAGGEYAAVNSIEARAEYFAARRMFGETADTRTRARRRGGLIPWKNQQILANHVEEFSNAWAQRPSNQAGGGRLVQSPQDIYTQLDDIGRNVFDISPGKWNISGRMSTGQQQRRTLKANSVRRAVQANERLSDPNSAQWQRRSVSGRMSTSTTFKRQNTAPTISPSTPEPLGIIRPQSKESNRSKNILEEASKVEGVTWSQPIDAKELEQAVDWATNDIVSRFTYQKDSVALGLPKLTEEQTKYLKIRTVDGRELTSKDAEDILGFNKSGDPASLYALIKQDAIERGDIGKAQRIDAFVERLQNMTPEEFRAILPDLLKSNRSRSDSRVHVMMSNPALLETTGRYLTIHDKKERDALGVGYTGFAQEELTADVRRSIEQSFGLPYTESEDVKRLRPASGFMPQTDSHVSRIEKLRKLYGEDIAIMHPYAMGQVSGDSNGVEKYGLNMVILRNEVSERTKIMRGDSAANRNDNGNAILPASEMIKPENASILHANSGASLLWDEMVGRGGLGSSSHKQRYNEAVVLGSFNLKDDVEAMDVSPDNFDFDADELEELGPGINPRVDDPLFAPTKLIKAARFRERMKNEYGIDTVVALKPRANNTSPSRAFTADNVELFNPAMTSQWMSTYFPEADLEEVIPDDKTTPYEAFIRHSTKRFGPDTLRGQKLREEIERIDEQKLRTHGEVALGQATRAEEIDSQGMELLPDAVRRSVSGRMSTQRVVPEQMVEVPELNKRGLAYRKQRVSDAENELAKLEEALRILNDTGEWRGGDLGVTATLVDDPLSDAFSPTGLVPNNRTAAEIADDLDSVKQRVSGKIERIKKEVALRKYLAEGKEKRVKQNVLDLEDISPEEYAILKEEGRYIRDLEAKNYEEFAELVSPVAGNRMSEFVIHAGASELDGGALNPARTEGDRYGGVVNNTQALNSQAIFNFVENRKRDQEMNDAAQNVISKLKSKKAFSIDSDGELKFLREIGFNDRELEVGSSMNLVERFGNNADDAIANYSRIAEDSNERIKKRLKDTQKIAKALEENPTSGFLSALPVSTGGFATAGYFGRWSFRDIPADVAEIDFNKPFATQEPPRKIVDQFMNRRWDANARGTAWLVDGSKAVTTNVLGPNSERQIVGTTKPIFGFSAQKEKRNELDEIGFAVMARAMQLQKDGKEVNPQSVLEYKLPRSVSGKMSTGASPVRPKYPRTPTYGVGIGRGDSLFSEANNWRDFKKAYEDKEIVFLDYETTGLVFDEFGKATSNGAPVQIGAVKVKNGKVIDRFNVFINPGEKLGEWSRNNLKDRDGNPLTDEWLSSQPSIADAHKQLAEFAGPDAIMGVQNASFDKNVLEDALKASGIEWTPSGYIDTKEISSMVLPRWTPENPDGPAKMGADGIKRPSNGLKEITEYLGVDLGSKHHTADADAEATAEVMQKIIDMAIERNWNNSIFDKNTRQAHIDKVNQKHLKEIEEFKIAREAFLAEVEKLAQQERANINDKPVSKKVEVFKPNEDLAYIEMESLPYPSLQPKIPTSGRKALFYDAMRAELERVGGFRIAPGGDLRRPGENFTYQQGNTVYHMTSPQALRGIVKNGLSFGPYPEKKKLSIALTPAAYDDAWRPSVQDVVVLRINPDAEFTKELMKDPTTEHRYFTGMTIPQNAIEVLNDEGKWVPLTNIQTKSAIAVTVVGGIVENPYNKKVKRAFDATKSIV